jgi:hypothetical protein
LGAFRNDASAFAVAGVGFWPLRTKEDKDAWTFSSVIAAIGGAVAREAFAFKTFAFKTFASGFGAGTLQSCLAALHSAFVYRRAAVAARCFAPGRARVPRSSSSSSSSSSSR